ncbi:MAG: hypothetical protein ACLQDL_14440 [Spirochaetia bacterium]
MWYTIMITLVVDIGGLVLVYVLLRDRVRRAALAESRISEIREEVSRLLVELNQATDRNIALMEDKIPVLNDAISTADKKIGLLRRETEKHDVGSQIYSRLAEGRRQRPTEPAKREDDSAEYRDARSAGYRDAQSAGYRDAQSPGYRDAQSAGYRDAQSPGDAVPALPLSVELSEQNPQPAAAGKPRGIGPDAQRVMMLYRAGFSSSLIASRVGAPVGEVELIISLEQRKGHV